MTLRTATWRRVFCLTVLAQMHVDAGDVDDGIRVLGSIADHDRSTFCAPEIHRIEGELLLQRAAPASGEAEQSFRRAIEMARARGEKSLELRAAIGLARALARTGRREEARAALSPIYGGFTEGFDTADLRAAKALLADLA